MTQVRLLVLKLGVDDPLDRIVDHLNQHDDIIVASLKAATIDDISRLLFGHTIDVLMITCTEEQVSQAGESARAARPDVDIIMLAVESGRANLTLHDTNLNGLAKVIVALGSAKQSSGAYGKLLNFRSPFIHRREHSTSSDFPRALQSDFPPANAAVLNAAMGWVESATRLLLEVWSGHKEEVPGLTTTWESIERWLTAFVGLESSPAEAAENAFAALERELANEAGGATPLGAVAEILEHDPIALKLFLIAIAGDLDMRFHRLFGALHDDFSRRRPSLGLAVAIIAASTRGATPLHIRGELAVAERLRRLGLVSTAAGESAAADEPLGGRAELIDWLVTGDAEQIVEPALRDFAPGPDAATIALIPAGRARQLRRFVRQTLARREVDPPVAVLIGGSEPGWLAVDAAAVETQALNARAGEVAPSDAAASFGRLALAANVTGRRLVLDLTGAGTALWPILADMLPRFKQPPFIVVDNPAGRLATCDSPSLAVVHFPLPSVEERRQAVAALIAQHSSPDPDLAIALGDRFPVAPAAMPLSAVLARAAATSHGRVLQPSADDWFAGFRQAAGARLPQLARRIEPQPLTPCESSALDRLVLPSTPRDQLGELVRHVTYGARVLDEWGYDALLDGKGVAALFSGESGTGKTTAAHAIASELGTDLYAIDLAQVVSKYIGETEKNLEVIFAEAQAAGAVLLFDEADALFGKRSAVTSAHDRYANVEVAYLLQRLQQFTGLAILTTNNAANIDTAFTRRLRFRIEFPRPAPAERLLIWEQSLPEALRMTADEPPGAPLPTPFDLKRLAAMLDVTGGTIRQMAFHAAVLAMEHGTQIAFEDVIAGARSQLVRLGRFEELARLDTIVPAPPHLRVA
ncbi:MAG: AAA family ATPase [Sandaracinobacter sp.]